jgi:carboxypeptidase C (cathepsin A)
MIYIEQPTGVGFSFSKTDSDYTMGDDTAAADMFTFINNWLERFPQYRNNDFHITSESYGGHYMPKLAYHIATHNPSEASGEPRINFKGFAVGNPYTDAFSNKLGRMQRYNGDSLLPKPDWEEYIALCGTISLKNKNLAECHTRENAFDKMIGSLNHYALDFPVCTSPQGGWLLSRIGYNVSYEPCETHYAGTYLNRDDVKQAIHARTDIHWYACAHRAHYSSSDMDVSMVPYYNKLIDNYNMQILVFSGDDDAVCSTWSTQWWIWDLGYKTLQRWQVWEVVDQVAGYYTTFEKNLAFVTVHAAGHEVPTFQPGRALELFTRYLNGYWFNPSSSNNLTAIM